MTTPTTAEDALAALFAALGATLPAGAKLLRHVTLPERIPPKCVAILRDGDPGEPEVTLCPLVYEYRHRAEIEVILQPPVSAITTDVMDAVLVRLGEAIEADRTIGGTCLWVETVAPIMSDLALEGVAGITAAVVPVELIYITTGPLA